MSGVYKPPVLVQANDYDPWGMDISSFQQNNRDNFKYSGKERITDFNLGWDNFGARMYDASIGRWSAVDPLAGKMSGWSPYNFNFNNPLRFIDFNGRRPFPVNEAFKGMVFRIDSWFGKRNVKENRRASKFHKGLDMNFGYGNQDYGAPVLSTHDGVASLDENLKGGEGRSVTITSKGGRFRTRYFHLSSINIENGTEIKESTQIGEIGGSAFGTESGANVHLHYEIQTFDEELKKWTPFDPAQGKGKNKENIVDPQLWITPTETQKGSEFNSPDSQMLPDATRVDFSLFLIQIKKLKQGTYRVVDGKIISN